MHQKVVSLEQVNKARNIFDSLYIIADNLCRNVKTTLPSKLILPEKHQIPGCIFEGIKPDGTRVKLRNINGQIYYANPNFLVPGLSQYPSIQNLFTALDPSRIETVPDVDDEFPKSIGAIMAIDLRNAIQNSAQKKPAILVLGDEEEGENATAYLPHLTKKGESYDWRPEQEGPITPLAYFNLPLNSNHSFTQQEIQALTTIYQETIGSTKPLLIHCSDGLKRTAQIVFAYDILHNFDYYFGSTANVLDINQKLYKGYQILLRTISPNLVLSSHEITATLKLGVGLKICSLFRAAKKQLDTYQVTRKNEPDFKPKDQCLENLKKITGLQELENSIQINEQTLTENRKLAHFFSTPSLKPINSFAQIFATPSDTFQLLKIFKEAKSLLINLENTLRSEDHNTESTSNSVVERK